MYTKRSYGLPQEINWQYEFILKKQVEHDVRIYRCSIQANQTWGIANCSSLCIKH